MSGASAVTLACRSLGEGPPLLLMHGLFGSGTNWRSFARQLADRRRVLLPDARNHGTSPHVETMSYPSMASDVIALLDAEGIEQVDVIGHSMGGKTAMQLALGAAERVSRLMVIDIAPADSASDHVPLIDALLAVPLERLARRGDVGAALADTVPDPALRAFLLQNLETDGGRLRWRINLPAIRANMASLLSFPDPELEAVFEGPTAFVRGERSDYVRDDHVPTIERLFPRARLHTVADAGHWVHADQPQRLLALVRDFLGEDDVERG